jgi:hypothetical protein
MTIQNINVGNAANDGTGDDLREAFIKVNNNFAYLSDAPLGVTNLGAGAGVFANDLNGSINLRSLVSGNPYVTITQLENTIVFEGQPGTFTISDGSNSMIAGGGIPMAIIGLDATTVSINDNTKTVSITSSVSADTSPQLGASLDGNNFSITNVNNIAATSILGATVTATNLVPTNINGVSYADRLGRYIEGFDFGEFTDTPSSILDFLVLSIGIDYGTFVSPNNIVTDFGFI